MDPQIETPIANGTTDQTMQPSDSQSYQPSSGFNEDFSHVKLVGSPTPLVGSPTPIPGPEDFSHVKLVGKPIPIGAPEPTAEPTQTPNTSTTSPVPTRSTSTWGKAIDAVTGFYDQTVGGAVNLVQKLHDDTAAYYKAHPGKEYLSAIPGADIGLAGYDVAKNYLFKDAAKDPQHPLAKVAEGIIGSGVDTYKKNGEAFQAANDALKNGDYKNAALLFAQAYGYALATAVPMVGPVAAKIGEDVTTNPEYAAGETGGLITSILAPSEIGSRIMPRTVPVGDVDVPVRAAVENPGIVNATAEALANKRMLQNFDVADTQSAARDAIANAATSTVRNPELEAARAALKSGAIGDFNAEMDKLGKGEVIDALKESYAQGQPTSVRVNGKLMPNIAQIDSSYNAAVAAANGDFGAVAKALNESISPLFEKASQQSIADGGGSWKEMADARDAAFRRGDVSAMNTIKADMRSAWEKANSTGSFEVANKLYTKLDDINRINDVFKSNAVVKPTPVDFVAQNRTAAGVDAGIIDGKALRTAVRKLYEDGTFKNAGVPQETVNNLQRLGELLERSKVKPGMASVGWFGRAGSILKGMTGADRGLAYLMTHPDALGVAISAAQASAGPVANQPTHFYQPESGEAVPVIQPD